MFNDNYNLTKLVLEGRKTMTRRIVTDKTLHYWECSCPNMAIVEVPDSAKISIDDKNTYFGIKEKISDKYYCDTITSLYQLGEVVAIAQSYQQVENDFGSSHIPIISENHPGWHNKMFVRADFMPHKIQIAKIRVERLQNISNEDCLNEGITKSYHKDINGEWGRYYWHHGITRSNSPNGQYKEYDNPREAFISLIDSVSGKGTWERNPFVWVYEFKLVK